MVYESTEDKGERRFIESIPNILGAMLGLTSIVSLLYNHIYFMVLGADISLVPLTMMDYTLTFREYIFLLIPVLLPFLPSIRNICENYSDKRMVTPVNRNLDKKVKIILYAICLFSVLPVWTIYDAYIHKNYFFMQPLLLAIFLIPITVGVAIFVTLSKQKTAFLVMLIILTFSIAQLWDISRGKIIKAFTDKNYIANTQKNLFILRVFEKRFCCK